MREERKKKPLVHAAIAMAQQVCNRNAKKLMVHDNRQRGERGRGVYK
jgi:hypothetical protein